MPMSKCRTAFNPDQPTKKTISLFSQMEHEKWSDYFNKLVSFSHPKKETERKTSHSRCGLCICQTIQPESRVCCVTALRINFLPWQSTSLFNFTKMCIAVPTTTRLYAVSCWERIFIKYWIFQLIQTNKNFNPFNLLRWKDVIFESL